MVFALTKGWFKVKVDPEKIMKTKLGPDFEHLCFNMIISY